MLGTTNIKHIFRLLLNLQNAYHKIKQRLNETFVILRRI